MNEKHYIGTRASSLTNYDEIGPITGVLLVVSNNNEYYQSGDYTGYVLTINCPYGTQEIANDILLNVYGQTYKGYRAEGAILKPEAELGDGVTVGDIYSVLAYRHVEFGPGHMSEIAAPGENEIDYEYQYKGTTQSSINNDVDSLKSYISRMFGELSLQITTLTGRVEALTQTVNAISDKVTQLDSRVTALEGK